MEELIYIRRKNGSFQRKNPTLKLEINGSRFILNIKAQENTGLRHDEGVMFGFNYKDKKVFMFKDDEPDSFILRNKSVNDRGLRFTSKDLANHFIDCFDVDLEEKHYFFSVAEEANEKGAFLIKLDK